MRRIPLPQLMGMRQPPMSTTTLLIVILGFVMDLLLLLTTTMLIAAILVMNTGRNANGDEAAKNPPQPQQPQNKPEVQTDTCGLGGHLLNEDGTAVTLAEGPTTTQALLVIFIVLLIINICICLKNKKASTAEPGRMAIGNTDGSSEKNGLEETKMDDQQQPKDNDDDDNCKKDDEDGCNLETETR